MSILLVSSNPLFTEAITEALVDNLGAPVTAVLPEHALAKLDGEVYEVLLIDDDIPAGMLRQIIKRIQQPNQPRLILLNCSENDFIILDCHRANIGDVSDLVQSIHAVERGESRR